MVRARRSTPDITLANLSIPRLKLLSKRAGMYSFLGSFSLQDVNIPFEITATEFLSYAKYDLRMNYNHHLVNALANVKRAIDCELDSLLVAFGVYKEAKRWHFPRKLKFVKDLGVVSPQILNKINKRRNLLEHQFKNPRWTEVRDYVDVADLFIAAANRYLFRALTDFEIEGTQLEVRLDRTKCKIIFTETTIEHNEGKTSQEMEIPSVSTEYQQYLKWFLRVSEDVF